MPPLEVFLSHSSSDRKMAKRIALALHAHGVPTFYSPFNVIGAQQWQDEILGALKRCDFLIVLLSPDAVESMWVRREVAYALQDRRYEGKILSLIHRPCDLGSLDWLRLYQMIDFQDGFDTSCRELLRVWGIGLRAER